MKTEVLKTELLQAIKSLSKLTTRKSLPILQCVEFRTCASALTLTATNLDTTASITIPARVTEQGVCAIAATYLLFYLKELNDSTIEIESTYPDGVRILSGLNYRSTETPNPGDFPQELPHTESYSYCVREKVLKEMLTLGEPAKCSDKARYAICGTLMNAKDNKLKLVTTNGKQLITVEKQLDTTNAEQNNITVPNDTIEILQKLLRDTWNLVRVSVDTDRNRVSFSWSGICVSTKLIEGNYPNYNEVIPIQTVAKFKLNVTELLRIVKGMFSNPSVTLTITRDLLTVTTLDRYETMQVDYQSDTSVTVILNRDYLVKPLEELKNTHITMELTDEQSAVAMRTDYYTYVLMPVRKN